MHILGFRNSKASSVLIFLFTRCGKLALIGLAFFTYTVCACMHVLAFPGQLKGILESERPWVSKQGVKCYGRVPSGIILSHICQWKI